jgi:hypothetical protein
LACNEPVPEVFESDLIGGLDMIRVGEVATFVDINMVNDTRICPVVFMNGLVYAAALNLGGCPIGKTRLWVASPASSACLMFAQRRDGMKVGGQLVGVYF